MKLLWLLFDPLGIFDQVNLHSGQCVQGGEGTVEEGDEGGEGAMITRGSSANTHVLN